MTEGLHYIDMCNCVAFANTTWGNRHWLVLGGEEDHSWQASATPFASLPMRITLGQNPTAQTYNFVYYFGIATTMIEYSLWFCYCGCDQNSVDRQ